MFSFASPQAINAAKREYEGTFVDTIHFLKNLAVVTENRLVKLGMPRLDANPFSELVVLGFGGAVVGAISLFGIAPIKAARKLFLSPGLN